MVFICFTVVHRLESEGWQDWLIIRVDSGILSVIDCTVKDKCIIGLCERIENVVNSSCRVLLLLTGFQILHFVGLRCAPRTHSKFIGGVVDCWGKSVGLPGRGGIAGGWFVRAVLLFRSRLRRSWLSSLMSIETGVDRWDRFPLHEIKLTSSLIRWEDWPSWPSLFKRSICNCSSLRRLISLVCLLRVDVAVFWWDCCFTTFCDSSLSSIFLLWFVHSAETRIEKSFFAEKISPKRWAGFSSQFLLQTCWLQTGIQQWSA